MALLLKKSFPAQRNMRLTQDSGCWHHDAHSVGYGICTSCGKKGIQPASRGLVYFLKCKYCKAKREISHAEYRQAKAEQLQHKLLLQKLP